MHGTMFSNYSTVFHISDIDNGVDVRRLFTGLFITIYVYDSCEDVSNYDPEHVVSRIYWVFPPFPIILITFFVLSLFFIEKFVHAILWKCFNRSNSVG